MLFCFNIQLTKRVKIVYNCEQFIIQAPNVVQRCLWCFGHPSTYLLSVGSYHKHIWSLVTVVIVLSLGEISATTDHIEFARKPLDFSLSGLNVWRLCCMDLFRLSFEKLREGRNPGRLPLESESHGGPELVLAVIL